MSQCSITAFTACAVRTFNNHFTTNLLTSLTVTDSWKIFKIWQSFHHELGVFFPGTKLHIYIYTVLTKKNDNTTNNKQYNKPNCRKDNHSMSYWYGQWRSVLQTYLLEMLPERSSELITWQVIKQNNVHLYILFFIVQVHNWQQPVIRK